MLCDIYVFAQFDCPFTLRHPFGLPTFFSELTIWPIIEGVAVVSLLERERGSNTFLVPIPIILGPSLVLDEFKTGMNSLSVPPIADSNPKLSCSENPGTSGGGSMSWSIDTGILILFSGGCSDGGLIPNMTFLGRPRPFFATSVILSI